ncbi:PREDICTED: protein NATD1-like [Dinoponera quadriceps]|uniref:Protein NATD1 n=1 Tax=Dinoponera quadriceps TaxID=609295 RepID=A0A6P3X009_DINQU|nr:PREDICTED: protein NATD1-like [Dinoponera quadriceps]XP_014471692.1 PREDICTED: protein NATD1-like [Dinoponera quadriceps]
MGNFALKSCSVVWRQAGNSVTCRRFLHDVQHSRNHSFFVQLDDKSRAVLNYEADGRVLYMRSVVVPDKYRGRGLARLLAETAFTYAIVNNYYMYLQCEYLQTYYLTVKNFDLEKHIVGPSDILEDRSSLLLDLDTVHELPEPKNLQS